MALSPQRGALFAYLRGHVHHLGLAKMSSSLRVVRIFTLTYGKTNVFGAPPEPGMPAADVPPRSRLRGVFIFEQNGALASMPCAFLFQTALEQ